MNVTPAYILGHADLEIERLQLQADIIAGVTRRLIRECGIGPGMRVLDIGTATGFFAFEFARRGAHVTAVDLPSLYALDRFPGQDIEHTLEKIEDMIVPKSLTSLRAYVRKY